MSAMPAPAPGFTSAPSPPQAGAGEINSLPPRSGGEGKGGGKPSGNRHDPRTGTARRLRRDATPAERTLWRALKRLSLDGHFRRQAPIGPYFADFAHHGCRLVIEVDGGHHNAPDTITRDAERTAFLNARGYRVMRFWNNEVTGNTAGVLEAILAAMQPPTPDPSPPQAGGGEAHSLAPPQAGGAEMPGASS